MSTKRQWLAVISAGAIWCGAESARADVFVLKSGGQIEAEWLNRNETPRTTYKLRTSSGAELSLARESVKDVVQQSELEKRYLELLPKMPATADGNWKMAEWCRERGLTSLREQHLRAVLTFDPEHEGARYGLGYSRIKGKWTTKEEVLTAQGYVKDGHVWRLAAEVDIVRAQADAKQAELEWRAKLKQLRAKLNKKGGDRALDEIRAIRDPAAAPALIQLLDDKNESPAMKLEYLLVLGRIPGAASTNILISNALTSDDDRVRDKCLEYLEARRSPQLTDIFVRKLKDDNATTVNRAADALGRLKDPDATAPLIEALVTRHKKTITSGSGGVSPTFDSNGGGSLSAGSSSKTIQYNVKHEEVLAALVSIHPGVNFGFEQDQWRAWYIQSKTPREVALRRDGE